MSEPQSTADLRILAEMAEEIAERGTTALPASLRSLVKTERGQLVARVLEETSRALLDSRWRHRQDVERMTREIDGLRNENQALTDAALSSERKS